MSSDRMLSVYFSHSWRPAHLPVNLALWERIAHHCHLLIDQPVQSTRDVQPPYYISRIESLMRRSDAFVACVPSVPSAADSSKTGDWTARCSPYILFEIRLAERLNLPRFILYDRESRFCPPPHKGPHVRYVPCRFSEISAKLERSSQSFPFADELEAWLAWLDRHAFPALEAERFTWGCLMGNVSGHTPSSKLVVAAMRNEGLDEPVDLLGKTRNDAELSLLVRSLSLLVVDVTNPQVMPLYHFAHAHFVPSIRLHPGAGQVGEEDLPMLLRGHPGGYQYDLVPVPANDEEANAVVLRARSIERNATPITTLEDGRYEMQQRGYKPHLVFLSHNFKPENRDLIEAIAGACREKGIDFWEYESMNRAGDPWKEKLEDALKRTTIFIPLLSDEYERRPKCLEELRACIARGEEVTILPFMLGNRHSPNPDLENQGPPPMHHERLPLDRSAAENAHKVVELILTRIRKG